MTSPAEVVTLKRGLIAWVAELAKDGGPIAGVQVAYSWPGRRIERECVHGGRAEFSQTPASLGGAGRRQTTVAVELHVVVLISGGTEEDSDVRAAEIGAHIEAAVLADQTLGKLPGLLAATVTAGDIDSEMHDDGAISALTLRVELRHHRR